MSSSRNDDGGPVFEAALERGELESVSLAITDAVAGLEEVNPTDLEPLYYSIDTEALNALFAPDRDGSRESIREITFSYAEYEITVTGHPDPGIAISRR